MNVPAKSNGIARDVQGRANLAPAIHGTTRAPRIADRHGRSLQRHAGPHHARAACGRSAGRPDQSAPWQRRLVRIPSRRRGDPDRHGGHREIDRRGQRGRDRAVAAEQRRKLAPTLKRSGCSRASPRTRSRSPRRVA